MRTSSSDQIEVEVSGIRTEIELDCRLRMITQMNAQTDWLEVFCFTHHWRCFHRHRRWGPWARCANRHVHDAE